MQIFTCVRSLFALLLVFTAVGLSRTAPAGAASPETPLDLAETIRAVLVANLDIQIAREGISASQAAEKSQQAQFLPKFDTAYQYIRNDSEFSAPGIGLVSPRDEYHLSTSITQPLFTGFALYNRYQLAALGLDAAKINSQVARQNTIFEAKKRYFDLLKAQKLLVVAEETVTQLKAQLEVSQNFYNVGMIPLNQVLQSNVELSNAEQNRIVAENRLELARANLNVLLRRPVNAPIQIVDIHTYEPFNLDITDCLQAAQDSRQELKIAALDIQVADRQLDLAKSDYYPMLNLQWLYSQSGDQWDAKGGVGAFSDSSSWEISATASWTFWEWGKTHYAVKQKEAQARQARMRYDQLHDQVQVEVKGAYLNTVESEKNIHTNEAAIEQARENHRINQERFKEQVATATDVLDAQTLLTRTKTNYYNALYDFKISKASLYRAMGQEVLE